MRVNIIEPYEVNRLKKLRVCAYVRVSTDSLDQADSMQNQSETYTRSITANLNMNLLESTLNRALQGIRKRDQVFSL